VVLSQRSPSTCYLTSIPSKRPLQVIDRLKNDEVTYTPRGSSSPPRAATRYKGESSQQGRHFTPSWAPSSSNAPHLIYDDDGLLWVPYQQDFHPRCGGPRSTMDRNSRCIQDRLASPHSGQGHQTQPVRPIPCTGRTSAAG
jgi:hypothetical protein